MELCHSAVETSVGWFREQQDKPAEGREATAATSWLGATSGSGGPKLLLSYQCGPWGEQSLQGFSEPSGAGVLLSQEKSSQEKLCRWLFVVQGKTCLGELGQIC